MNLHCQPVELVNNRLAKMRRLLMTAGTDFSGHKHALVSSLTEEGESERESGIYPNSQKRGKKYSFGIYSCSCSALTRIFIGASLLQNRRKLTQQISSVFKSIDKLTFLKMCQLEYSRIRDYNIKEI